MRGGRLSIAKYFVTSPLDSPNLQLTTWQSRFFLRQLPCVWAFSSFLISFLGLQSFLDIISRGAKGRSCWETPGPDGLLATEVVEHETILAFSRTSLHPEQAAGLGSQTGGFRGLRAVDLLLSWGSSSNPCVYRSQVVEKCSNFLNAINMTDLARCLHICFGKRKHKQIQDDRRLERLRSSSKSLPSRWTSCSWWSR